MLQTPRVPPTAKTEEGWNGSCCWGMPLWPLRPQQPLPGCVKHAPPKEEIVFQKDSVDLPVTVSCLRFRAPASDGAGKIAGEIQEGAGPKGVKPE